MYIDDYYGVYQIQALKRNAYRAQEDGKEARYEGIRDLAARAAGIYEIAWHPAREDRKTHADKIETIDHSPNSLLLMSNFQPSCVYAAIFSTFSASRAHFRRA